jgi:ATP sulfurylase
MKPKQADKPACGRFIPCLLPRADFIAEFRRVVERQPFPNGEVWAPIAFPVAKEEANDEHRVMNRE